MTTHTDKHATKLLWFAIFVCSWSTIADRSRKANVNTGLQSMACLLLCHLQPSLRQLHRAFYDQFVEMIVLYIRIGEIVV